jgi:TRAP-type uncharacterized transport system fused permease subunit
MSAFHLWVAFVGPPEAYVMRGTHLAFALVLTFLVMPGPGSRTGHPGWIGWVLVLAAAACALYPTAVLDYIRNRMYYVDDPRLADYIFGGGLILLLIEATRRATGWALPITAIVFLAYGADPGWPVAGHPAGPALPDDRRHLRHPAVRQSATYVMLFVLFGAFMERSGAGQLFMDFALALAGHTAAGRARWRSSRASLFGTISGSAVANVMVDGPITIPLMKRSGLPAALRRRRRGRRPRPAARSCRRSWGRPPS